MKKSLFILSFVALSTAYTQATELSIDQSYTTANKQINQTGFGNYTGFSTKLNSIIANTTLKDTETAVDLPTTVYLNKLTLTVRPEHSFSEGLQLAIYQFTADGTVGDFLGLSQINESSFSFNSLELNSTSTYQFLFVNSSATEELLNQSAGSSNLNAYKSYSISQQLTVVTSSAGSLPGGSGTYKSSSLNSWEGQYLPKFEFFTSNTKTSSIPEPTTATLSILSLIGLMARRCRQS